MASRERPGAVTVLGVITIIFGALLLLCGLCLTAGQLAGGAVLQQMAGSAGGGAQNNPLAVAAESKKEMDRAVPYNKFVLSGIHLLDFVLGALFVVGGIGLLGLKPWARSLCLFVAAAFILLKVVEGGYRVVVVNPNVQRLTQEAIARQTAKMNTPPRKGDAPAPAPVPAQPPATAGTVTSGAMTAAVVIAWLIYPAVLLVMLSTASVKAAFAGRRSDG